MRLCVQLCKSHLMHTSEVVREHVQWALAQSVHG